MSQRVLIGLFLLLIGAGLAGIVVNKASTNTAPSKPINSPMPTDLKFTLSDNSSTSTASVSGVIEPEPKSINVNGKTVIQYPHFPGAYPAEQLKNKAGVIETDKGKIAFILLADEAPKAVSNFAFLASHNFYNGLTFHRVVPGFVIQGGDPLGNGTGGPGYKFEDEPVKRPYNKGVVAMANAGPNTNGSQFFIMLESNPTLPPNYTIFGQVFIGQEVVEKISVGDIMNKVYIANVTPSPAQ